MATKRRKGEKPIVHEPLVWSEDSTVARAIRTGDGWLYAWIMQQNVRMERLEKLSGLTLDRLNALWRGEPADDQEIVALAGPFNTDTSSLRASIHYARLMRSGAPARQ